MAATLKAHNGKGGSGISHEDTFIAAPLTKGSASGDGVNAPGRRQEDDVNLVAHTLRAEGFDASEDGTGRGTPLIAEPYTFDWQVAGSERTWIHDKPEHARSLTKAKTLAVHTQESVRRLTPRECERLQALPDDWTLLSEKTPDSRRYSALGDAVTSSVAEWIGRRIAASGAVSRSDTT